MKYSRQEEIINLIGEYEIETQEELSEQLRERGYRATQATISRDIRELKLVKVAGTNGKYKYAMPYREESSLSMKARNLLIDTVEKVDRAGNITVVKTFAGMAQGVAAAIDSMGRSDVVGSVAGDDTIIIVMRTGDSAQSLADELEAITSSRRG